MLGLSDISNGAILAFHGHNAELMIQIQEGILRQERVHQPHSPISLKGISAINFKYLRPPARLENSVDLFLF